MQAILFDQPGEPEVMYIGEYPTPQPKDDELLVRVRATALNRADTLQRKGKYPPPKGASPIMGLEMAGEIEAMGKNVTKWKVGDRVMALLPGGGYATRAVIPESMAMSIPDNLDYVSAAAIPEVFLTAFQAIDWLAGLQIEENVLIHAGASGVGTAATQIAIAMGANVFATASKAKHQLCLDLGAKHVIDYQTEDFEQEIQHITEGKGVQVIIDFIAAPYLQQNLNTLSMDGRLVILALLGGVKVDGMNMAPILRKRLKIIGSTLRSRSGAYKISLTSHFWEFAAEKFKLGMMSPIIDSVYPWEQVAEAHDRMERNENAGKIVLEVK